MSTEPSFHNRNIRIVTALFSVALAFAGATHGFFEMLQGNVATGGLYINSIGPEQGMWGEDPAITLIPNFLITGITAMILGMLIAIWAVFFVQQPRGPIVLLLLFIAQTLAGGGIGYIPFYLVTYAWSSRIRKPPPTWPSRLPDSLRQTSTALWLPIAILSVVIWIWVLIESIAGFLVPALGDAFILNAIGIALAIVMVLINFAFIGAALRDAQTQ